MKDVEAVRGPFILGDAIGRGDDWPGVMCLKSPAVFSSADLRRKSRGDKRSTSVQMVLKMFIHYHKITTQKTI